MYKYTSKHYLIARDLSPDLYIDNKDLKLPKATQASQDSRPSFWVTVIAMTFGSMKIDFILLIPRQFPNFISSITGQTETRFWKTWSST